MVRYPDKQSVLEAILKTVDSQQSIRSVDVNARDASLYKFAAVYCGSYYDAVQQAAEIRRVSMAPSEIEDIQRNVLLTVQSRWSEQKSIHPDEIVREEWALYWNTVVAFGSYTTMVTAFGQKPKEILARRLWPKPQVDAVLIGLYQKGQDMSVTAMTLTRELKRIHTATRRAYKTYEAALKANKIPVEQFRRQRKVTDQMVIDEFIAYARAGNDVREWRVFNDDQAKHMTGNARDHFGDYRSCLAAVREYLLAQGEVQLAEKFDYEQLQAQTRRESRQIRKQKNRGDLASVQTAATYNRQSLEKLLQNQLEERDFNLLFEEKGEISGNELRFYLQCHPGWATPDKVSILLDCSDDNIKRHKVFDVPQGVIIIYRNSKPQYFINTQYKDRLQKRKPNIDFSGINKEGGYTLRDLTRLTGKSPTWWRKRLSTPNTREPKQIPGRTILKVLGDFGDSEALFTLTEAGRVVGISEYRSRQFVEQEKVIPVQRQPILLDQHGVEMLEDLITHETAALHAWRKAIDPASEYQFFQLVMLGLPYSGIYEARKKGFIPALCDDEGRAVFRGKDLLAFLARYNSSYIGKFTRGVFMKEETIYTPEEIVRLTEFSFAKVRRMISEMVDQQQVIILQSGDMRHYLIQKVILNQHLSGKKTEKPSQVPLAEKVASREETDVLLKEYLFLRDRKQNVEAEIGLDLVAMRAVVDHILRGTYTHVTKKKTLSREEFLHEYDAVRRTPRVSYLAGQIVEKYGGLVSQEARRFFGVDHDDLLQEGRIALLNALERHDSNRGNFEAYARSYVRGTMNNLIAATSRTIRIPGYMHGARKALELAQRTLPGASPEDLSARTGHSMTLVRRLMTEPPPSTQSLDAPMSPDDDRTHQEIVANTTASDAEKLSQQEQTRSTIRAIINSLPERERKIIIGRIWEDKTLDAIGEEENLTKERIRQLEKKAFDRLRKRLIAQGLGLEDLRRD